MKKLRVYYMCSLLSEMMYFEVATPAEGKRMIEALQETVQGIINEKLINETGGWSIGLEVEDDTMEEGWADWMSEDGWHIDDCSMSEAEQAPYFRGTPY